MYSFLQTCIRKNETKRKEKERPRSSECYGHKEAEEKSRTKMDDYSGARKK